MRKTFQWQLVPGDRIGMAARHHVEYALFVGDVGDRRGERRVDVADKEIHLVAIDQFACLLHRGPGIAAG